MTKNNIFVAAQQPWQKDFKKMDGMKRIDTKFHD